MDTSNTYKAFLDSETCKQVSPREHKELDKLMMQKIVGPAGMFVFSIDRELTERARQQTREAASSVY